MQIKDLKPVRRCPHCCHLIPSESKTCPYCESDELSQSSAFETPNSAESADETCDCEGFNSKTARWILVVVALVVVGVVVGLLVSKDKSTDSDEYYSAYDEFEMAEDDVPANPVMPADEDYPSFDVVTEASEEAPTAYESASEDLRGTYTGTLDERISITVVLTRYYDNVVSGYYYYGNGDNGNLELDGYIDDDTLHFTEFSNGEITGSWTLSQIGSCLVGTMTNYKGREFSVFLEK